MRRLDGYAAIVTGADGGIGRAVVERLLSEGAHVSAVDLSFENLRSAFRDPPAGLTLAVADVTSETAVRDVVTAAYDTHHSVDIVVNAAGVVGEPAPFWKQTEEEFDHVIAVNLKGTWQTIRQTLPYLRASGGGAIVNLASTASRRGAAGLLPYVVSKHAVVGLTRTLALELVDLGIRVNAVAPGPTDTSMMETIDAGEPGAGNAAADRRSGIPLGRYARPQEVAAAVAFLAGSDASYITGAVLEVDGGLSAGAATRDRTS